MAQVTKHIVCASPKKLTPHPRRAMSYTLQNLTPRTGTPSSPFPEPVFQRSEQPCEDPRPQQRGALTETPPLTGEDRHATTTSRSQKVLKLVEITHVRLLDRVVEVPSMIRQQGHSLPRISYNPQFSDEVLMWTMKWYTLYAAYQDKWPSDSFPGCKDLTSVRNRVCDSFRFSQIVTFAHISTRCHSTVYLEVHLGHSTRFPMLFRRVMTPSVVLPLGQMSGTCWIHHQ